MPAVVSFGALHGGIRYNIIPDSVEMIGTIRTFDPDMRTKILADLANVAENVSIANGATAESQIPDGPSDPVTVNDPARTHTAEPQGSGRRG